MEYVKELIAWLPTVKINIGMGITVSLLQIMMFPVACHFLKIIKGSIIDHAQKGFGRLGVSKSEPSRDDGIDWNKKLNDDFMSNNAIKISSPKKYYISGDMGND